MLAAAPHVTGLADLLDDGRGVDLPLHTNTLTPEAIADIVYDYLVVNPSKKEVMLDNAFGWASKQLWSRRVLQWHALLQSSNKPGSTEHQLNTPANKQHDLSFGRKALKCSDIGANPVGCVDGELLDVSDDMDGNDVMIAIDQAEEV